MTPPEPVGIFSVPQQWEYRTTAAWGQKSPNDATEALKEHVRKRGQEGWEMVNFAISPERTVMSPGKPVVYDLWSLVIYFKRPVAP
jgi:hypothetical protein